MKRIVIVGFGAAGILCLHNLHKAGFPASQIIVVDPYLDGGDLARKWPNVRSNTVWRQILEAVPPRDALTEPWLSLSPDEPCSLRLLVSYLLQEVRPILQKCELRTGFVDSYVQTANGWTLQLRGSSESIQADILLKCTGAEPKILDLPFAVLPLEVALDPGRLAQAVCKGQHLLLFGTAHSSTLIVKHLVDLGCRVTNVYATPEPFYFAAEGHYDGIKQEAAEIAQRILRKELPNVELVKNTDSGALLRKARHVDFAIYACGFGPRDTSLTAYDGETGKIKDVTGAWGFGIAYPNRAPDGQHWDVSVPAFQTHIQKQLPEILSSLGIEA